jgi:hypothetical protein
MWNKSIIARIYYRSWKDSVCIKEFVLGVDLVLYAATFGYLYYNENYPRRLFTRGGWDPIGNQIDEYQSTIVERVISDSFKIQSSSKSNAIRTNFN